MLIADSGVTLTGNYLVTTLHLNLLCRSVGSPMNVMANGVVNSDENASSFDACVLIDGGLTYTQTGGYVGNTHGGPLVIVSGSNDSNRARAVFVGTTVLEAASTPPGLVTFAATTSIANQVVYEARAQLRQWRRSEGIRHDLPAANPASVAFTPDPDAFGSSPSAGRQRLPR